MILKKVSSDSVVSKLHKISTLRLIAKKFLKGYTLQQSFHGGAICLDAVEHSWAWTGNRRYETFDFELQDKLLSLSQDYSLLIDIGSNIGAMSLSLLLRNPSIRAICIDPNSRAITLLQKSVSLNNLTGRVEIINAAVCNENRVVTFDESGSVTGHISLKGRQIPGIQFTHLINKYSTQKCLIKIDIEGFEANLLPHLSELHRLPNLCLVLELHPLNFNQTGNPSQCLEFLLNSGAIVSDINGQALSQVKNETFTQIVAHWLYA